MQNRSAFTAELNRTPLFRRLINRAILFAHADEDGGSEPQTEPAVGINFEQAIAQARKEEKDKLYPRIKKAEEEVKTLTASVNKYLLENAALKEELEKMKTKPDDSKVKELEARVKSLEEENNSLKENTPNEDEIRKRVEAEYEVKLYAQEQIATHKGSILSILIPDITGKTKEEVDSAIASAKEKTISIKKDLGLEVDEDGEEKPAKKTPAPKQKKVPVAAPSQGEDGDEFDAEYIRNLDPRSEEYKEFRKKMGLR